MSGWLAFHLRSRLMRSAAGISGVLVGMLVGTALAEPPPDPSNAQKVDERPPLPPENTRKSAAAAKYHIDPDKAIFQGVKDPKTGVLKGGIEDNRPLASEKQNADEYRALTDVVLHVSPFTAQELCEHGRRDLTPDDLTLGMRQQFRLELIRFEGILTRARRVPATAALDEIGFKELYEAWLVPDDESPGNPLCLLLTTWPADLPQLPEITAGQATGDSVTMNRWVAFGGFSFKLMAFPGPGADPKDPLGKGWQKVPLLIGKSVVPEPKPAPRIELDKNLRVFNYIRDNARMQDHSVWEELTAWNRVVLHARKFAPEELEAAAQKLVYADLAQEHRKDYKLEPVSFQGRLIRLTQMKPTERLAEAGVTEVYEGWFVPDGEPRGNPICVILSELPPGLAPKALMSVPISVAGYSFKLMHYVSGEQQKDDPSQGVWKKAPLLIGHTVIVRGEDSGDGPTAWASWFVPVIFGSLLLLIGVAVAMSWWFRSGDRQARAEIEAARSQNPFEK